VPKGSQKGKARASSESESEAEDAIEIKKEADETDGPSVGLEVKSTTKSNDDQTSSQSTQLVKYFPGAPWMRNSCWLDASLQLLYIAITRHWEAFRSRFAGLPDGNVRHALFLALQTRYILQTNTSGPWDIQRELQVVRDKLRDALFHAGTNVHLGPKFQNQSIFVGPPTRFLIIILTFSGLVPFNSAQRGPTTSSCGRNP
jgi:hypothetical protein